MSYLLEGCVVNIPLVIFGKNNWTKSFSGYLTPSKQWQISTDNPIKHSFVID